MYFVHDTVLILSHRAIVSGDLALTAHLLQSVLTGNSEWFPPARLAFPSDEYGDHLRRIHVSFSLPIDKSDPPQALKLSNSLHVLLVSESDVHVSVKFANHALRGPNVWTPGQVYQLALLCKCT